MERTQLLFFQPVFILYRHPSSPSPFVVCTLQGDDSLPASQARQRSVDQDIPLRLTDDVDPSSATSAMSQNEGSPSSASVQAGGEEGLQENQGMQEEGEEHVQEGHENQEERGEGGEGEATVSAGERMMVTRSGVKRAASTIASLVAPDNRLSPSLNIICGRRIDEEVLKATIDGERHLEMSQESRRLAFLSAASLQEVASHVQVFLHIMIFLHFVE